MEPVKRYDPDVDDTGKACTQENPKGGLVTSTDYDTLLTDHARCVQDARRMAEKLTRAVVAMHQWLNDGSALNDDPEYRDAQRVLETWKEGV